MEGDVCLEKKGLHTIYSHNSTDPMADGHFHDPCTAEGELSITTKKGSVEGGAIGGERPVEVVMGRVLSGDRGESRNSWDDKQGVEQIQKKEIQDLEAKMEEVKEALNLFQDQASTSRVH